MSESNTEEKIYPASPRKREKAREEGQVAKSTELVSLVTLSTSLAFIYLNRNSLFDFMDKLLYMINLNINAEMNLKILKEYIISTLSYIMPLFILIVLSAFLTNYAQIGLKFMPKVLKPDIKKINPVNGFKRMFSKDSLVELIKALLKVVGVLAITIIDLRDIFKAVNYTYTNNSKIAFEYIFKNIFNITIKILLMLLSLAILDYVYKKFKFEKDLRMTRQEMLDENKENEGNPETKQRQREFARMLSRKQIQKVKDATVLIVNPTHYAIALKHDYETHPTPVILFKGVDEIALAAKQIATENDIPIVENIPLARTLYKIGKEDECIPQDMFEAVAKVLSYIYTLKH